MPAISLSDADPSTVARLKSRPDVYMRNAWQHPNRPQDKYDFKTTDGEKRLRFLTNEGSPLRPRNWGGINILLWARGGLKTTALEGILTWAHRMYGPQGFESYMTAPREGQVKEFTGKFHKKVEQTGLNRSAEKKSIGHTQFKFDTPMGGVYSSFKTDTGWGEGDALRGPHVHFGIIDEFQDLDKASFDTFREAIDREIPDVPYFPSIFLIGTPKMENSFFHEMWKRSDQKDWNPDENQWETQSEAEVYGEGTEDSIAVRGWHISQHDHPMHDAAKIKASKETYSPKKFQNEVRAQFYSPEDELISDRHLDAIAHPSMGFTDSRTSQDSVVVVGVDWGGGSDRKAADTVVAVVEQLPNEERAVIQTIDFLDTSLTKSQELTEIEERIQKFDPEVVCVDEGYGVTQREDLQTGDNCSYSDDGYDNVYGIRFGNTGDKDDLTFDGPRRRFATVNKYYQASSFVERLKDEAYALPTAGIDASSYGDPAEKGTKIYSQLTAPYEERSEGRKSGRKTITITSDSNRNDDCFDALTFADVGLRYETLLPNSSFVKFGAHDRR